MSGIADRLTARHLAVAALVLALCGALSVPALGDPPSAERKALLDSTVAFLQESQQQDGGFAQAGEPSQGTSAWVALALAAAGINPRNQAKPCGTDAYAYLVTHFHEEAGPSKAGIATTALARELLVVDAAGADPHDFAGFDLVAGILERQLSDGSFPNVTGGEPQINTTIFAMLALSPIEEPAVEPALSSAAEWLIEQQNGDGGWYWRGNVATSEVDMTGAAIEALNAVGAPSAPAGRGAFETAQEEAFEYLEGAQLPDGGFPALPASQNESNVASTAWAVQGIWSAGGNPEAWRTGSGRATEEPLDYMESMQQPDGHIRWSKSSDVNGVWMTAYVAPAFAGQALPIPAAALSSASVPPCDTDGGAETGVIAGGGGKGAPLFSRPKPQSKGRTPGGARIVRNSGLPRRSQSQTRRGANAKQPTGTETAEPNGTGADGDEVAAVSSSAGPGAGSGPGGAGADDASGDAGTRSRGDRAGGAAPAPLREAVESGAGGAGGREVSGVVIGGARSADRGELAFGAPGLRSGGGDPEPWVAIGIGAAALLVALSGARWERRHQEALP